MKSLKIKKNNASVGKRDVFSRSKTHIEVLLSTLLLALILTVVFYGVDVWSFRLEVFYDFATNIFIFGFIMYLGFYVGVRQDHEKMKQEIGSRYLADLEASLGKNSIVYLVGSKWFAKTRKRYEEEGLLEPEESPTKKGKEASALRNAILKEEKRGE